MENIPRGNESTRGKLRLPEHPPPPFSSFPASSHFGGGVFQPGAETERKRPDGKNFRSHLTNPLPEVCPLAHEESIKLCSLGLSPKDFGASLAHVGAAHLPSSRRPCTVPAGPEQALAHLPPTPGLLPSPVALDNLLKSPSFCCVTLVSSEWVLGMK